MISESVIANAFRSDRCLDLEGLKSDQEYLSGYMDAHHDFTAGLGEKNLCNPHQRTQGYLIGYLDSWSEAQRGLLNSECRNHCERKYSRGKKMQPLGKIDQ